MCHLCTQMGVSIQLSRYPNCYKASAAESTRDCESYFYPLIIIRYIQNVYQL